MRKIAISTMMSLLAVCSCFASSVGYQRVTHGRLAAHAVTVNLADPTVKVTVGLAAGGAGRCETFRRMINRTRPAAAITGTFFDTKTLIPTGDILLRGTLVHKGVIGSALCIDANNKAAVVPLKEGRRTKWAGYETVLCAGPTLVSGGKVAIGLKHEGFRRSLMTSTRRTAVGITKSGKLVLICVNRRASLYQVAKLMIAKLGVQQALCLDGGSSTAFYYQGSYLACPQRTLTNCLMVYSTEAAYARAKTALAPSRYFAKADPQPSMGAGPAESILRGCADASLTDPADVLLARGSDVRSADSQVYSGNSPSYRTPTLGEAIQPATVSFQVK